MQGRSEQDGARPSSTSVINATEGLQCWVSDGHRGQSHSHRSCSESSGSSRGHREVHRKFKHRIESISVTKKSSENVTGFGKEDAGEVMAFRPHEWHSQAWTLAYVKTGRNGEADWGAGVFKGARECGWVVLSQLQRFHH